MSRAFIESDATELLLEQLAQVVLPGAGGLASFSVSPQTLVPGVPKILDLTGGAVSGGLTLDLAGDALVVVQPGLYRVSLFAAVSSLANPPLPVPGPDLTLEILPGAFPPSGLRQTVQPFFGGVPPKNVWESWGQTIVALMAAGDTFQGQITLFDVGASDWGYNGILSADFAGVPP